MPPARIVDLHLHTTASDGRCTPSELVTRAWRAGIRVMAVTDHDTMTGVPEAVSAGRAIGMDVLRGIEITSVDAGRDVHVLGYNLPDAAPAIERVLQSQRTLRVERAREIAARLERMGAPIDTEAMIAMASASGKALARPHIAQCLVAAGRVTSIAEAFDRYLGENCGGYVPHQGASPAEIVALIVDHGGVASLAHPGRTNRDHIIAELVAAGLSAIEAYHSSHDSDAERRYLDLARHYGLAVTGGSDYHGEGTRLSECFGVVGLPREHYPALLDLMQRAKGPQRAAASAAV